MNFKLIEEITPWAEHQAQAFGKKVTWGMTSNMTLITPKVNEFLKQYDYFVLCSMDGWKKSHDTHRRYPPNRKGERLGSFEQALKGLKRYLSWRRPYKAEDRPIEMEMGTRAPLVPSELRPQTIRWTLSPLTTQYVLDDIPKYMDLGLRDFAIVPASEADWNDSARAAYKRVIEGCGELYKRQMRRGDPLYIKSIEDGMRPLSVRKKIHQDTRCGLLISDVGVGVDGTMWRCHRLVNSRAAPEKQIHAYIGNIFDGIDRDICRVIKNRWRQTRCRSATYNCGECIGRLSCQGGCLAVNFDTSQDDMLVSDFTCWHHQTNVAVAMQVYLTLRGDPHFEKRWQKMSEGERRRIYEEEHKKHQRLRQKRIRDHSPECDCPTCRARKQRGGRPVSVPRRR